MGDRPPREPLDFDGRADGAGGDREPVVPDDVIDAFLRHTAGTGDTGPDQRPFDALRVPVAAPDNTHRILEAIGNRRGWLDARARRRVIIGRYAAAGLLVGLTAGALLSQRYAPSSLTLVERSTPVTDLVETSTRFRAGAAGTFDDIAQALGIMPAGESGSPAPGAHPYVIRIDSVETSRGRVGEIVDRLEGRLASITITDPRDLWLRSEIHIRNSRVDAPHGPCAAPCIGVINLDRDSRYCWSGLLEPEATADEDLLESVSR